MKKIALVNFLVCLSFQLFGQPPCGNNTPAGETCETATPICDLNGYCGNTFTYSADAWGDGFFFDDGLVEVFCGTIENDSYLSFTASETTISFDVWVTSSSMDYGIQLIVYPASDCNEDDVDDLYCEEIDPLGAVSTNVSVSGLTIGESYHIMIDGVAGDQCEYIIGANTGIAIPIDVTPANSVICLGESVDLLATGGDGIYTWDASPDLSATSGANVSVTPSVIGSFDYICNSSSGNPLCPSATSAIATVVVNACGCVVTASNTGPICENETFDLSATTVSGATSYSWTGPNGYSSTIQNPTDILGSSGAIGDYTVTVTSPDGICESTTTVSIGGNGNADFNVIDYCIGQTNSAVVIGDLGGVFSFNPIATDGATVDSSTGEITNGVGGETYTIEYTVGSVSCAQSSTQTVTVNELPTPLITGSLQYCVGTLSTLSADQAYTTYDWSNGLSVASGTFSDVDNPITLTVTDGNGCSATSDPVNVYESEIITYDTITICQGSNVDIHGNLESLSGNFSQTFVNSSGCDSVSNIHLIVNSLPTVDAGLDITTCDDQGSFTLFGSGALTYTWDNGVIDGDAFIPNVGSQLYTVIGTDLNGCTDIDSLTITVNPNLEIFAGDDILVCDGVLVNLSASILLGNGTGPVSFVWNNGAVDGVDFSQPVGTLTYTVTGTDINGCQHSDDVEVTIAPLPNINAGLDQSICDGQLVSLSASGGVTYNWDNGVTNGVPFSPTSNNLYTVTGTDANGCVNTDDVNVVIESSFSPTFVGDDLEGCAPHTVTFTNTSLGISSLCVWDFGNGETANNCGPVTVTYSNGVTYDVTLTTTSDNGCTGTVTYVEYISVEDPPIASFSSSVYEVSVINPDVDFNNSTSGNNHYLWNFGDGSPTTTIENPSHTFPDENQANYTVYLVATSALGCVDTAWATITVNEELIYYVPNTFTPDGDDYNDTFKPIFTDGFDPYDYTLLIFNRWGEIVFESNDSNYGWDGTYNESQVQDGTYTWKIEFKTTKNDERIDIHGHLQKLR